VIVRVTDEVAVADRAHARIVRSEASRGQEFTRCRRVGEFRVKLSPERNRIDIVGQVSIESECSLPAYVHQCALHTLLDAEARVASARNRSVTRPLREVAWSEQALRRRKAADGAVVRGWREAQGRQTGHTVHLVSVEAVIECAEAAAQSGLAVSKDVIGETDARRGHDVLVRIRVARRAVHTSYHHAITEVTAVRHIKADLRGWHLIPGSRIDTDAV